METIDVRARTLRGVLALLALCTQLAACGPGHPAGEAGSADDPGEETMTEKSGTQTPVELSTPGEPRERELPGGEAHVYDLELDAGRYVSVAVEQRGIDVYLRLRGPSGELLTEVDSPIGDTGTERVRAVAETAGTYRLEVRSFEGRREPGKYAVQVEESRPATAADRTRVRAERAFAEGETLRRDGGYAAAVERYQAALEPWRELEDREGEALALYRIGWMRDELGHTRRAADLLRESLALDRDLGNRTRVAVASNRLGNVLARLGHLEEARQLHLEALELATRLDHRAARTWAEIHLGDLYKWSGRTRQALERYERALELARPAERVIVRYHMGDVYLARNDAEAARLSLETALEQARAHGNRETEAFSLVKLGEALRRLGRTDDARARLEEALALQRKRGDRHGEALALASLGTVLLELDRLDQARQAFEQTLEISSDLEDVHGRAAAHSKLGRFHFAAGAMERAMHEHETALPLFEATADRQGVASSHYGIARAHSAMGRYEECLRVLEQALDEAESLRSDSESHELRASYLASRRRYWDLYVTTLMRLHEEDPQAGFDRLALHAAERWRARGLLDLLAEAGVEIRQGAPAELLEREHRLRREIDGIERRRLELLSQGADEQSLEELEERQARLLLELDRVRSDMRVESGRYRELTDPDPLDLGEVRSRLLDEDTTLLVYFLGEEQSALWLVTPSAIESRVLADRATIEEAADAFRELLQRVSSRAGEARRPAGARLSRLLLGPVDGRLRTERLAVVTDGALQTIPFGALPVPGAEREILLERHEIVHLPSASVLGALRRMQRSRNRKRASKTVAVIADPVFRPDDPRVGAASDAETDPSTALGSRVGAAARAFGPDGLRRLPHTQREARTIAELAPGGSTLEASGFEATRSLVEGDRLADYRILHFATHGLIHRRHPDLSGLVLSLYDAEGEPRDGFLRLHDVYNLKLGAELVVLSACETGLGRRVEGEGLVGLTRGFMYAGAPRIVHSLWEVSDESTAELMARVYRNLFEERLPPQAALRRAQLAMRASDRWSEPFYWAGFVFQGDWEPPSRPLDDDIEQTDGGGGGAGGGTRADEDLPTPPPPPAQAELEKGDVPPPAPRPKRGDE